MGNRDRGWGGVRKGAIRRAAKWQRRWRSCCWPGQMFCLPYIIPHLLFILFIHTAGWLCWPSSQGFCVCACVCVCLQVKRSHIRLFCAIVYYVSDQAVCRLWQCAFLYSLYAWSLCTLKLSEGDTSLQTYSICKDISEVWDGRIFMSRTWAHCSQKMDSM